MCTLVHSVIYSMHTNTNTNTNTNTMQTSMQLHKLLVESPLGPCFHNYMKPLFVYVSVRTEAQNCCYDRNCYTADAGEHLKGNCIPLGHFTCHDRTHQFHFIPSDLKIIGLGNPDNNLESHCSLSMRDVAKLLECTADFQHYNPWRSS
jgi:hypothetical protein